MSDPSLFRLNPRSFRLLAVALFLVAAFAQLGPMVHGRSAGESWFLFGTDTVSHDLPVLWWLWEETKRTGELPLWMAPLRGGLPTLGAFLWVPLAPFFWLFGLLPLPLAHRLQFISALAIAGLGAAWTARVLGMRRDTALLVGMATCLGGHVVTLIHAGHLQKVLALAWLPWFAGGTIKAIAPGAPTRSALVGVAVAGLALGMAFLCGHPQVAYMMLLFLAGRAMWSFRAHLARLSVFCRLGPATAGIVLLGMGLGAFQLLPGSDMSRHSNRAGGVEFSEAVATSYPPAELPEFFLPRFKGDSSQVGHGVYHGDWGERLVSDYAGVGIVLLALMALVLAANRREAGFWWSLVIFTALVGVGHHTPFYRALYDWLPGMSSFRSPGTFFALIWIALPVLAGIAIESIRAMATPRLAGYWFTGILALCVVYFAAALLFGGGNDTTPLQEALQRSAAVLLMVSFGMAMWLGSPSPARLAEPTLLMLLAVTALDLSLANRAFLRAEPWENYEAYMSATPLDIWARESLSPIRIHEPGRESSLRPLFTGRDALLGYHPIEFRVFEDLNREAMRFDDEAGLGPLGPNWRAAFGVSMIAIGGEPGPLPDGLEVAARFPDGSTVVRDLNAPRPVELSGDPDAEWEWVERLPNRDTMRVRSETGVTVTRLENTTPAWEYRIDGGDWVSWPEITTFREVELQPGEQIVEWRYHPSSWRIGLFLTVCSLATFLAILLIGAPSVRHRSPANHGDVAPQSPRET